ncbi:MAG: magnesium chelatase domain-containing protein, partial [Oscillospiraceae bacterium]
MVCSIKSFGINGIDAFEVTVEVDFLGGLPRIDMAGLPDTAIKESRDRINSAITNSGYEFPRKHFVINLAPADRKKTGPVYDLPILIAVLKASEQVNLSTDGYAFAGEVALDGKLRGITGALSMVIEAKEMGYKAFFLPKDNSAEAAVVEGINVYGAENLRQVCEHLEGKAA